MLQHCVSLQGTDMSRADASNVCLLRIGSVEATGLPGAGLVIDRAANVGKPVCARLRHVTHQDQTCTQTACRKPVLFLQKTCLG